MTPSRKRHSADTKRRCLPPLDQWQFERGSHGSPTWFLTLGDGNIAKYLVWCSQSLRSGLRAEAPPEGTICVADRVSYGEGTPLGPWKRFSSSRRAWAYLSNLAVQSGDCDRLRAQGLQQRGRFV